MTAPASPPETDADMGTNDWPPPHRLVLLGLQHVLVMYAGVIAFLVNAALFASGIATLVQSVGARGAGIQLPVMMGVTFVAVTPMLALIAAGKAANTPAVETLSLIFGSVIAAGIIGILAAPLMSVLPTLFPQVVTGTIILTIGISLMPVGINWAAGGLPVSKPDYGAPAYLGIAAFVLLMILLITRLFDRGHGYVYCAGQDDQQDRRAPRADAGSQGGRRQHRH